MVLALFLSQTEPAGIACLVSWIHALLGRLGLHHGVSVATMWVFFAGCGLAELLLSVLVCTPLERFWPLTSWPKRHSITADVVYALFVRTVLFPLVAFFEYDWLLRSLHGLLSAHSVPVLTLSSLLPWSPLAFLVSFAILDLADYWRHRLSHRYGWWYGIHSLHHAEDQMTFWSDDRSHLLEDAITYLWLIVVGLCIGVPSIQFPFLILGFRFLGSIAHANTQVTYGWLGERIFISPQFHRTHHALKAAGRRSANYGTALPWWDILFGTARFNDATVETGDAGAEPALVSGSWGEQQTAGVRRMIRLGRRGNSLVTRRSAS